MLEQDVVKNLERKCRWPADQAPARSGLSHGLWFFLISNVERNEFELRVDNEGVSGGIRGLR